VGNHAGLMRLEGSDNLEGLRKDANDSIGATEEDIVGASCDAGDVAWLCENIKYWT